MRYMITTIQPNPLRQIPNLELDSDRLDITLLVQFMVVYILNDTVRKQVSASQHHVVVCIIATHLMLMPLLTNNRTLVEEISL